MIVHDVEQGSPEWLALRLGIPTASDFDKIITPKTLKLSASARAYACRLVAEKVLGYPLQDLSGVYWVERGSELEPQAVKAYEFSTDRATKKVGFITTDDGLIGASPDRILLSGNGLVEIKCPAPATHIGYLVDGFGADYLLQVQGQMFVGGFDFVDRFSFHPELPPKCERIWRDDVVIDALAEALPQFLAMRDAILHSVMDTGFFDNRHKPAIEADGFVTMDQLLNELDERAAFQAPCEEI